MTPATAERIVKFIMGGLAVVAAFILAQGDVELAPAVKVALGAFLAFAAYADPVSLLPSKYKEE